MDLQHVNKFEVVIGELAWPVPYVLYAFSITVCIQQASGSVKQQLGTVLIGSTFEPLLVHPDIPPCEGECGREK